MNALSLLELGIWAAGKDLAGPLAMPIGEVVAELALLANEKATILHVAHLLRVTTLGGLLRHSTADAYFRHLMPTERHGLISAFRSWLDGFVPGSKDAEALPVPSSAHADAPPAGRTALQAWAAHHDVSDRLGDPATVLALRLHRDTRDFVETFAQRPTVGDLACLASAPLHSHGARARFDRMHLTALAVAARGHLADVAAAVAKAAARRRALDSAAAPEEPRLAALGQQIDAARAALAAVVRRPLGTYVPISIELADRPARLVYRERSLAGEPGVIASFVVEAEPLAVVCSCSPGRVAVCAHALSALDEAHDLLRDPQHPARARLVREIGTPGWSRFLEVLEQGLARRAPAAPSDGERLAYRILHGHDLRIEPLLQKRLKKGGWSQGQRIAPERLTSYAWARTDPREARVIAALTDGLEEGGGYYGAPSRARTLRALEALAGHPRVFLAERGDVAVRIERARLRLLLEPPAPESDAIVLRFALGARRLDASALRAAAGRSKDVVVVDPQVPAVLIATLDDRVNALLDALEQHPARFPKESHDDMLRALQPLQESLDLELPPSLEGEPLEADRRLVVRLSPHDDLPEVDVAILVRPVAGGPAFEPGEGPPVVVQVAGGRRVSAHRDLAGERETAAALARSLPRASAVGDALAEDDEPDPAAARPFAWKLPDEEHLLDLLAALRLLGDAVTLEWPKDARRIAVTGAAIRRELRLRVTAQRDWFGVEGEVSVDGENVSFGALLDAVRRGRRYVQIAPGRFAAIEDDLRKRLATAGDLLFQGRHGLEVGLPAADALNELVDDPGHLQAVVGFRDLVRRIDASRALDPVVPPGLLAVLRPYQAEGFRWLARLAAWGMGGCLADDMGLGKTVQALALLLARAPLGPALVIAPTSVAPNWIHEAERFAPGLRARLYRDTGRAALLAEARPGDVLVTSYALVTRDAEALRGVRFSTLVIDEAQAIKNALTDRARAVRDLEADFRVALTGTPVENHLGELWSLMRILAPGLLGSWDQFRERFAAPIERSRDPQRRAALVRAVRPFLLRRTKAEVAPELPARTEIQRFVDLSPDERRLYDETRREALAALASGGGGPGGGDARFAILAALSRLRRLACHPRLVHEGSTVRSSKLAALLEVVSELRETGHRALVFSQFTSHLALVREALDGEGVTYAYLDGSTPSEERTRRIAAFQAGQGDLFLISLKAGGTGLNLTGADFVIHLDPWWNPAVEDQATDRAHRIGQTRAVTVVRLIARGTIEEAVLALHGDKRALAASVFDEQGGPARLSVEDLAGLIRAGLEAAASGGEGESAGAEIEERAVAGRESRGGSRASDRPAAAPVKGSGAAVKASGAAVKASGAAVKASGAAVKASGAAVKASGAAVKASGWNGLPTEAEALAAFADEVLDDLAKRKNVVDRRYDSTLRTYERSLRRFAEYVVASAGKEVVDPPAERLITSYLEAIRSGKWQVPSSEPQIAGVVMNHVRAFLAKQSERPAR